MKTYTWKALVENILILKDMSVYQRTSGPQLRKTTTERFFMLIIYYSKIFLVQILFVFLCFFFQILFVLLIPLLIFHFRI